MFTSSDIVVGIGDLKVSNNPKAVIVTYSLGSCIGLVAYDFVAKVGGMLHFMLDDSSVSVNPSASPCKYADMGIPLLFERCIKLGALKNRLVVRAVGGANTMDPNSYFDIGGKNYKALRKILKALGYKLVGESIGGGLNKTLRLDIGTGQLLVKMPGNKVYEL